MIALHRDVLRQEVAEKYSGANDLSRSAASSGPTLNIDPEHILLALLNDPVLISRTVQGISEIWLNHRKKIMVGAIGFEPMTSTV
jgi:hypothetical protein